jgi:hypothetical protein
MQKTSSSDTQPRHPNVLTFFSAQRTLSRWSGHRDLCWTGKSLLVAWFRHLILACCSGLSIPGAEKSVREVSSRERRERERGLGGARSAIAGLPGRIPVLRAMAASLLQSSSLVVARRTGLDLYGVQFGPHLELELVSSSSCCRRSLLQAGSASSSPPPASLHGECTKSVLCFRRQAS